MMTYKVRISETLKNEWHSLEREMEPYPKIYNSKAKVFELTLEEITELYDECDYVAGCYADLTSSYPRAARAFLRQIDKAGIPVKLQIRAY